jgi:hypothetical protein
MKRTKKEPGGGIAKKTMPGRRVEGAGEKKE